MMMMMDGEEEITWNLKGPKRMKKRRELNALIRNNIKYKSLPQHHHGGGGGAKSDEFSMINCSTTGVGGTSSSPGRLLNGLNYSSTDDEQRDFFFAANKSVLKQ